MATLTIDKFLRMPDGSLLVEGEGRDLIEIRCFGGVWGYLLLYGDGTILGRRDFAWDSPEDVIESLRTGEYRHAG